MTTIVVVDDEFLLVDVLAFALEDEGYDVMRTYHGKMALEAVKSGQVSLVITDFMMPLMTGLELADALKQSAAHRDIPVILVTGAQGAVARAHHSHLFAAVFDKPYSLADLLDTVRDLVGPP